MMNRIDQCKERPNDFKEVKVTHGTNLTSTWLVPHRYEQLFFIRQGSYGQVCSAFDKELNMDVAIKKLIRPFDTPEYAMYTYRELQILKHMDHENIVCLIDVFAPIKESCLNDLYFVTPLMRRDLKKAINESGKFDDKRVAFIGYQIFRAIKYLHSADIVHRDLKPSNIAINDDDELKVLDFGTSRKRSDVMTGYVISRHYRAPEVVVNWQYYSTSVDIWSIGCIMMELLLGKVFLEGRDLYDQFNKIIHLTGTPQSMACLNDFAKEYVKNHFPNVSQTHLRKICPEMSNNCLKLLDQVLVFDPKERISAESALKEPYFSDYHDSSNEKDALPYTEDPCSDIEKENINEWKNRVVKCMKNFSPCLNSLPRRDS